MHSLILLALLTTAPTADRWIPFPQNTSWEIFGKEDATGRFVYTATRQKAPAVTKNFGVNLSAHSPTASATVMGTDSNAAKLLLSNPTVGQDCDRNPKPKPFSKKKPELAALSHLKVEPLHIVGLLIGLAVLGASFVFFILFCVVLYKLLSYALKRAQQ